MKRIFNTSVYTNVFLIMHFFCTSCSKLIEVDPPITSTNGGNVFSEDGSAIAVLTGIYTNMSNASVALTTGYLTNVCFTTGLTGDELKLYNTSDPSLALYYNNNILAEESTWSKIYEIIFVANSAIEQLPNATSLTPSIQSQLLGEAKFIRALCYFYLVNLYGDVPLAISSDYKTNGLLPRTASDMVYKQIVLDLTQAQSLLGAHYIGKDGVSSTAERIRPNKWAATALLARVYLYTKDYVNAEVQATSIIENGSLYDLVDLNSVFLKNSKEAIWQLQPVGSTEVKAANTREGQLFNLVDLANTDLYTVYLNEYLLSTFENYDQRRVFWIDSIIIDADTYYFPYKYKLGYNDQATEEYSTVFRLSEQYLIRAEARIQQEKIIEGIADINRIRTRATDLTAMPNEQLSQLSSDLLKTQALLAIEHERQIELFTEWGHRWFDLKRTNRASEVLKNIKSGWQATDQLFPIPQAEVTLNPNMIGHQNPGYN
jgi:starch-binding outer membrane protein, SusD/RagB family